MLGSNFKRIRSWVFLLCSVNCLLIMRQPIVHSNSGHMIGYRSRSIQTIHYAHRVSFRPKENPYRKTLSCKWVDECVSLDIPTSAAIAYNLYSQLDQHPRWSPWLYSVTYNIDEGHSTWMLRAIGIRVSWESINTVQDAPTEIAWKSITGLENRGRVLFEDCGEDRCKMTLTLSYDIPRAIAAVLKMQAAEVLIKRTLLKDLQRFSDILLESKEMNPMDVIQ